MHELIPAKYRWVAYSVSAVIALIVGSIQVGYSAADLGQPLWLTVTNAVYAFAAGSLGVLAATHTQRK